jgi:hypothetical protein
MGQMGEDSGIGRTESGQVMGRLSAVFFRGFGLGGDQVCACLSSDAVEIASGTFCNSTRLPLVAFPSFVVLFCIAVCPIDWILGLVLLQLRAHDCIQIQAQIMAQV